MSRAYRNVHDSPGKATITHKQAAAAVRVVKEAWSKRKTAVAVAPASKKVTTHTTAH